MCCVCLFVCQPQLTCLHVFVCVSKCKCKHTMWMEWNDGSFVSIYKLCFSWIHLVRNNSAFHFSLCQRISVLDLFSVLALFVFPFWWWLKHGKFQINHSFFLFSFQSILAFGFGKNWTEKKTKKLKHSLWESINRIGKGQ